MTSFPLHLPPDAAGQRPGAVTPDSFRDAFRRHPAGVAVVTLAGRDGPRGLTVSSFQSVSMEPPLVAFGIAQSSSVFSHLAEVDEHVVNLLGRDHLATARRFATSGVDRFAAPTRWTRLPDGLPVLDEAVTWLHCTVEQRVEAGDHHLIISRVTEIHRGVDSAPVVYHDGDFHATTRILRSS